MLSIDNSAMLAHPLAEWVPGEGFVGHEWVGRDELIAVSGSDIVDGGENISVLAYVANGTQDELSERLDRIYAFLAMRPELRLVDVVEDIDGRRLRQVAREARGRVGAIVTTLDSFMSPEHLKFTADVLDQYGIRLIVVGSYGF